MIEPFVKVELDLLHTKILASALQTFANVFVGIKLVAKKTTYL